LQRKCACGKEAGLTGKCRECEHKSLTLPRQTGNRSDEVPPIVHEVLESPGQPLDSDTRAFMESRFGQDFSQVRIHTDAKAAESASLVEAKAYTVGWNVVLGKEGFNPNNSQSRKLLAHELAHVLQQHQHQITQSKVVDAEEDANRVATQITTGVTSQIQATAPLGLQCQPLGEAEKMAEIESHQKQWEEITRILQEGALQDLFSLSKDDFLQQYQISEDLYIRLKKAFSLLEVLRDFFKLSQHEFMAKYNFSEIDYIDLWRKIGKKYHYLGMPPMPEGYKTEFQIELETAEKYGSVEAVRPNPLENLDRMIASPIASFFFGVRCVGTETLQGEANYEEAWKVFEIVEVLESSLGGGKTGSSKGGVPRPPMQLRRPRSYSGRRGRRTIQGSTKRAPEPTQTAPVTQTPKPFVEEISTSLPRSPRRVAAEETELSRLAQQVRNRFPGRRLGYYGGNIVIIEISGQRELIHFESTRMAHAEKNLVSWVKRKGIDPSSVTRIYSERIFCGPERKDCLGLVQRTFPQAELTYTYPYALVVRS
jgi:hypothetical protein